MSPITLSIGGFTPFTTLDYPDHLAAIIFCQGCVWRCHYCHNPHLLDWQAPTTYTWEQIDQFLQRRRQLLEAVVFSGGEPTLQKGLIDAVQRVRELGFRVGLHTAGIYPHRLSELLPYLHWVGLDIKAPFTQYEKITGVAGSDKHPLESVKRLIASGLPYEVRTTLLPYFLTEQDLLELAESLAKLGVQHYVLQNCRVEHALDPSLRKLTGSQPVIGETLLEQIRAWIPHTVVR